MTLKQKQGLARKLKVVFTDETTEEQLDVLIKEAEDKKAFEAEQEKIRLENEAREKEASKKKIILRNTSLEDVDQKDYFFKNKETGNIETAPAFFNKICGTPVDQEELVTVFDSIFPKKKGFLFYKVQGKELYLVIVPLKYATTIGEQNDSIPGDFQKHAMSFIGEGSVGIESLKQKLTKIANHSSIAKEELF